MLMTAIKFESVAEMLKAVRAMATPGFTFNQYLELKDYFTSSKGDVLAVLNKSTKKDLEQLSSGYANRKKDRLVSSGYDSLMSYLTLSKEITVDYFNGETYERSLNKAMNEIDEPYFIEWQAKRIAETEAFKKSLDNPETLSEFREFIMYKGINALTSEQLALYDSLKADVSKASREKEIERKSQLSAVTLEGIEFTLLNSYHTKKNIPLWVVQLSGRVERDQYNDLNQKAKALNGYYSSFRGNGAIPGFTFTEETNAKAFMSLQSGSVDASAIAKEREAEKVLNRAETLEVKADRLESGALESLNRDRKDNTERRARMASNAESRAMSELEFSKTMDIIAKGLKDGSIKYLDRLQNYTELDELYNILNKAKWDYIDKNKLDKNKFELVPAVCDLARIPWPSVHIDSLKSVIFKLRDEKGKTMAANRIIKSIANFIKKYPNEPVARFNQISMIEAYERVLCSSSTVEAWRLEQYKVRLARYNRIKRLGLNEAHMLRAALRELVNVRLEAVLDPEIKRSRELKELDRKFINSKIDGFFPTPEKLAAHVVEIAEIKPGHKVGEFSAGLGHLATAIIDECPEVDSHLVEINPSLAEALRLKGFEKVDCSDFLELTPTGDFDRVVINPPFENNQDIKHVMHAWEFLKPGGCLVAIMAGNKVHGARNAVINEFMDFVDTYGTLEENEPGAFLSAFRPTGVSTVTVKLYKPTTAQG